MDELKLCSNDIMHLKDKKSQADELRKQLIETDEGIAKAEEQVLAVQQRLQPIEVSALRLDLVDGYGWGGRGCLPYCLTELACRKHCSRLLTNKTSSTSCKLTLVSLAFCPCQRGLGSNACLPACSKQAKLHRRAKEANPIQGG